VRLEKHGPAQLRLNGQHRGIEALQVARLQNAATFVGSLNQIVGFGQRGCQSFSTSRSSPASSSTERQHVMHGGNGDCGCVEMKVGS